MIKNDYVHESKKTDILETYDVLVIGEVHLVYLPQFLHLDLEHQQL